MEQYYKLLGINPGAGEREIKKAYRKLVKKWHPDRFPHDARKQKHGQEKLTEINEAYAALISALRKSYEAVAGQDVKENGDYSHTDPDIRSDWKYRQGEEADSQGFFRFGRLKFWAAPAVVIAAAIFILSFDGFRQPDPYLSAKEDSAKGVSQYPVRDPSGIDIKALKDQKGLQATEESGKADLVPVQETAALQKGSKYFRLGSTKYEVLAAQGSPTFYSEKTWQYGHSRVIFDDNRVVGWYSSPLDPLRVRDLSAD